MGHDLQSALAIVGLGAAPFQQFARASPSPAPTPGRAPPTYATPTPVQQSASGTLQRTLIEQALPSQTSVGSDYQWATLNSGVWIGGHLFPAGTRVVVSLSQMSQTGGGKAHTTSTGVKVWAKFGQTFDSSSWLQGTISLGAFTLTGQSATWSSQTGFGGPGRMPQAAVHAATSSVAYSAPQQSFPVDYGSQSVVPPNPMSGAYGDRQSTAHQTLVNMERSTASNAMDAGGHIIGRPASPPPFYPRPPAGSGPKKPDWLEGLAAPHGGGGHHGGGHHGGGWRRRGRRFGGRTFINWPRWWGSDVYVASSSCSWLPSSESTPVVRTALAALPWQSGWRAAFVENAWWGETQSPHAYFVCVVATGLYGIPEVSEGKGGGYTTTSGDHHINGIGVNLRERPDASSKVIATLQNGEGVYVFGDVELDSAHAEKLDGSVIPNPDPNEIDGIYYVRVGTQTHGVGWVSVNLLQTGAGKQVGGQPAPSPTPAPAPAPPPPEGMGLVSKVLLGGAIGATIAGGAFLIWKAVENSRPRRLAHA